MNTPPPLSHVVPVETHRCVECGQLFLKSELMAFTGFYSCAQCKPRVVEKIARGEPVGAIWRDGKKLVALVNTPLLDRCVKCNAPAEGYRLKRNLYWHHPAIYLLLLAPLVRVIAYLIVAVIVRKRSKTPVGLCPAHRSRRILWIWICIGGFVAGLIGLFASLTSLKGNLSWQAAIAFGLLVIASLITVAIKSRVVYPARITRTHVFLIGVHPDYLEQLPVWPGS